MYDRLPTLGVTSGFLPQKVPVNHSKLSRRGFSAKRLRTSSSKSIPREETISRWELKGHSPLSLSCPIVDLSQVFTLLSVLKDLSTELVVQGRVKAIVGASSMDGKNVAASFTTSASSSFSSSGRGRSLHTSCTTTRLHLLNLKSIQVVKVCCGFHLVSYFFKGPTQHALGM